MVASQATRRMEPRGDRAPDEPRAPFGGLDEVVFECLERLERDGIAALDEMCTSRPELAAALRRRIEALRESGLITLPGSGKSPSSPDALWRAIADRLRDRTDTE